MKISLDNEDRDDGTVFVTAASAKAARRDQSIDGNYWNIDEDFAYAILEDRPGLADELREEGYIVDGATYDPLEVAPLE